MCGGGKSAAAAPAPAPTGPTYTPADNSNRQRQAAAIETDGASRTSYGSELGTTNPTTGGV